MEHYQLVIQFLERVVDENIKSVEKLSNVKFIQEEQRREVAEILAVLKNGLKDDLKRHVSEESSKTRRDVEKLSDKYDELNKEVKEHRERSKEIDIVLKDIRNKGLWIRGFITLVVALATIAGAFITLSKIAGWSDPQQQVKIHQPQIFEGSDPRSTNDYNRMTNP